MKENIHKQEQVQVVIRLKPQTPQSKHQRCAYLASESSNALVVEVPNKKQYFVFDSIIDEETSQFQLYQSIGQEAVHQSLQGYNCCIFAYGQTGSGKTYSILGIASDIIENIYAQTRGILPRLLQDLFKNIKNIKPSSANRFTVKCSYMEIYNQQIFDLLNDSFQCLQIRQAPQKGVYVEGINNLVIQTYEEAINILLQGQKIRKTAETGMNKESSRSHTIFTINLQSELTEDDTTKFCRSKINIIDLAGSQRVKHTNVQGQRLKEGCNINKSLHVLGNVINALVLSTKKKKHIPFRDSKLTYYLKDSLGGNSITKLLANIQCGNKCLGDTLSTLMFAKRAKILKMKVEVNQNTTENYEALRKEIKKLREQLAQAKYINQTRLSDRFLTQNQTEQNLQKFDTSNIQFSTGDKPIQIFQQNQLHYKALIQIYEQHMLQCTINNQNLNSQSNKFIKKKNHHNILTHNEWKKLQKKNTALVNLVKRVPAFTKIYRENILLKQQRNYGIKENIQKNSTTNQSTKELLFKDYELPAHSRTLQFQNSSQSDIMQQSFIPNEHQKQVTGVAVQQTINKYEQLIRQIKEEFCSYLTELDKSYGQLQKQVQQKDKKIKQISRKQYQLPSNLEELVDENQYLKLNILQLESEISILEKDLEQAKIKQREEGRRLSLFQQPMTNRKVNNHQSETNSLNQSLQIQKLDFSSRSNNKMHDSVKFLTKLNPAQDIQKVIETSTQAELCSHVLSSLSNFRNQMFTQVEKYEIQKQNMINCIQMLQKQCKRLMQLNKKIILKNQDLKTQHNQLFTEIKNKYPDFSFDYKIHLLKSTQQLWKQFKSQTAQSISYQQYQQSVQIQMESLYTKIKEMEKIKYQLNIFINKEENIKKQFGKSINEILEEYAEIIEKKSQQYFIKVSFASKDSRQAIVSPKNLSQQAGQHSGFKNIKNMQSLGLKLQYDKKQHQGKAQTLIKGSKETKIPFIHSPKK